MRYTTGVVESAVMSIDMKYLIFAVLLITEIGHACIAGPQKIEPSSDLGFTFTTEKSDLCSDCSYISIIVPDKYKDTPAAYARFSVYSKKELVSRSVSRFNNKLSPSEFGGVVSNTKGISYEIDIEYGVSRCTQYKMTYKSVNDDS